MEVSSFLHHTCTRVERNKIMQEVREKAPEKKKEKKKRHLQKLCRYALKNNTTTKKQHQQQNQPPMSKKKEERRRCGRVRERERETTDLTALCQLPFTLMGRLIRVFFSALQLLLLLICSKKFG
jgi:hypothetical protein